MRKLGSTSVISDALIICSNFRSLDVFILRHHIKMQFAVEFGMVVAVTVDSPQLIVIISNKLQIMCDDLYHSTNAYIPYF